MHCGGNISADTHSRKHSYPGGSITDLASAVTSTAATYRAPSSVFVVANLHTRIEQSVFTTACNVVYTCAHHIPHVSIIIYRSQCAIDTSTTTSIVRTNSTTYELLDCTATSDERKTCFDVYSQPANVDLRLYMYQV